MMIMNLNMRSMIKRRREQEEDMDILMNLMLPLIPFRLVKVIPRLQALTEKSLRIWPIAYKNKKLKTVSVS